ncbi:MAG: hypothetical protein ACI9HE_004173 [Planctomycetota bacterium]|jgi:hypothetical protein
MVDRLRARTVLTRARDILAERMCEMILESEEGLVQDAQGTSYMDEIGTVYEQVGGRLNHVNTLLSHLPALAAGTVGVPLTGQSNQKPGGDGQVPATFMAFGQAVARGEEEQATAHLAELFGIDKHIAGASAATFADKLKEDSSVIERTMQMREDLRSGSDNRALLVLHECFGLSGLVAIQVLQFLKEQHGKAA